MNIAILLSGGTGSRINSDIPKQYIKVNGDMILTYSLKVLLRHDMIHGVVIVADKLYREMIDQELLQYGQSIERISYATPGKNRQMSIYNALKVLEDKPVKNVFIHDAARPCITSEMITEYFTALNGHDGVLPVLPMKDTIYMGEAGKVTGLLERSKLFAGQAPEIFDYKKYLRANEALMPDRIQLINGSSEPAFLADMDIVMAKGYESNYKITTDSDLERFIKELSN